MNITKINNASGLAQAGKVEAENEALIIVSGGIRCTDKKWSVNAPCGDQLLLNRCAEAFINILYCSDRDTLLKLRLVSRIIHKLSMQSTDGYFSPLMCKVLIPLPQKGLKSEKVDFALAYTGIHIQSLNISYIQNTTLLSANVRKRNFSLALEINCNNELRTLNKLLSSDDLSNDQKWILSKIKELDLVKINIDGHNVGEIGTLLRFFASQLTTLSFWDINAALVLPELPSLTKLWFSNINATLVLPELPSLTKLVFHNIRGDITRQNLQSLLSNIAHKKELAISSENEMVADQRSQKGFFESCVLF